MAKLPLSFANAPRNLPTIGRAPLPIPTDNQRKSALVAEAGARQVANNLGTINAFKDLTSQIVSTTGQVAAIAQRAKGDSDALRVSTEFVNDNARAIDEARRSGRLSDPETFDQEINDIFSATSEKAALQLAGSSDESKQAFFQTFHRQRRDVIPSERLKTTKIFKDEMSANVHDFFIAARDQMVNLETPEQRRQLAIETLAVGGRAAGTVMSNKEIQRLSDDFVRGVKLDQISRDGRKSPLVVLSRLSAATAETDFDLSTKDITASLMQVSSIFRLQNNAVDHLDAEENKKLKEKRRVTEAGFTVNLQKLLVEETPARGVVTTYLDNLSQAILNREIEPAVGRTLQNAAIAKLENDGEVTDNPEIYAALADKVVELSGNPAGTGSTFDAISAAVRGQQIKASTALSLTSQVRAIQNANHFMRHTMFSTFVKEIESTAVKISDGGLMGALNLGTVGDNKRRKANMLAAKRDLLEFTRQATARDNFVLTEETLVKVRNFHGQLMQSLREADDTEGNTVTIAEPTPFTTVPLERLNDAYKAAVREGDDVEADALADEMIRRGAMGLVPGLIPKGIK